MAYNNMHEVSFRDALARAHDDEVADARDYWQKRADAGNPGSQHYADACRAELKAREDATTERVGSTYRLSAVEVASLPRNYARDNVAPGLVEDVLAAGADRRSVVTTVEEDLKDNAWIVRVTGLVRS